MGLCPKNTLRPFNDLSEVKQYSVLAVEREISNGRYRTTKATTKETCMMRGAKLAVSRFHEPAL